ncbi:MAG: GNAT family N-acetyltransferase [Ruminococcus sp.]|nr:GNAT family N-acetyltransferase [Ruminococcus sp.]
MKIIKADNPDLETVKDITYTTINQVYPKYYPKGAVDFFLAHHSSKNIEDDIAAGKVFLLLDDSGTVAGTVTVDGNDIGRFFVLPQHQGKGYGRALLSHAEEIVKKDYSQIVLSSSLPAKAIYMKKGYISADYNIIETENGDFLCFDTMIKNI